MGGELAVVAGNPTEEELAALICVVGLVAGRARLPEEEPAGAPPGWRPAVYRSPLSWSARGAR
ncbi:hypothetical protein GCM10010156_75490 [Planobispora rosea]|uniref:Acyl-CoA carboxylase subunit epsilon n=1 Tax=Planobispora rosea TaxID=35762 RepID=A0A8J3SC92_PLARO|nr:acyl-CoA carboxylase subunit epsilon [Planobispora rosea]GGT07090.1 hypothetical protein GCM10010156_75490 [Planobispora rosea]GIH89154.1 hypothetical protein Pro02_75620 [Planobispora rosea]